MMTTCRTCRGRVAKSASACPHCGAKRPGKSNADHALLEGCGWILAGVVVLIVIVAVLFVIPAGCGG